MTVEGVLQMPARRPAPDGRLAELSAQCAEAFRHYLAHPDESGLLGAYEFGRRALGDGLGVIEMTRMVSSVVAAIITGPRTQGQEVLVRAAEAFLVETLSPFEMAHRGYREANTVLRRLNDMLESQARHIAASLHDEASELLTPLHLSLADIANRAPAPLAGDLAGVRSQLDRIERRLRVLAHELRPPALDQFGLLAALELLAEATSLRHGLEVCLHAPARLPLPATVEAALYRMVQEALTNVVKHAHATRADVTIAQATRQVTCTVSDDGIGLQRDRCDPAGIGLAGMRERVAALGGTLRAGAADHGVGTVVVVEIPLEA